MASFFQDRRTHESVYSSAMGARGVERIFLGLRVNGPVEVIE